MGQNWGMEGNVLTSGFHNNKALLNTGKDYLQAFISFNDTG
jgi:hypothetical protein